MSNEIFYLQKSLLFTQFKMALYNIGREIYKKS